MLQVAASVFAARGYHATSMDEIAERADISKPLLYRYYGSKDGLYLALLDRAGEHLIEGLSQGEHTPDPFKRIDQAVGGLLGFIDRYRDFWQVLYAEALCSDSPVSRKVQQIRTRMVAIATVTIAEALGDPTEAGRRDAEPLAYAVLGSGEALSRWWLQHPAVPAQRIHEMILDFSLPTLRQLRDRRRREMQPAHLPLASEATRTGALPQRKLHRTSPVL